MRHALSYLHGIFKENSDNLIDAKMSELKDLIDNVSVNTQNIMYEWQNKEDHELVINFTFNDLSIKYEFDIDSLFVAKYVDNQTDFTKDVESIDEGLDIIEKDIYMVLGINESYYLGQWDSSISEQDLEPVLSSIKKCQLFFSKFFEEDLVTKSNTLKRLLSEYHPKLVEFLIELFLFSQFTGYESIIEKIILFGDDLKYDYDIEPTNLMSAIYKILEHFSKIVGFELLEKAKTRGEKYKGKHIPAKYLTRKKGAMKKEIDTFRGKKEYKKDWEADYDKRSGKRIKTKKSAATKAYQRMFGDK